jgi:polysaccharide chain length determinant protein (PEP-CTERM system associated)
MQEVIDLILSYARAVWMKRWYALGIAWLVCLVGWALVMRLPDQYEASARVNIDTQSFLKPLLRGLTFSTSPTQQIQLMVSTLLSRPNLEKIARMTDLDLQVKTDQEMDQLLGELKDNIKLLKESRQDLYVIKFEHEDRDVAKRVVQAVLTLFVENTLGENRQESVTAKRFLDAEIKEYEQRLKDSEQRLVDFKRKNLSYLSSGGSDYYQRLQAAMGNVESSKLMLTEAKRQRDSIREQIEDQEEELSFVFDLGGTDSVSTYDRRIEALQSNLDAMFLKYTDKHPDVITLKAQLSELEEKREEELAARAESGSAENENPVLQSLKLSLGNAQSQVAALMARVKAHEQKVTDLQKLVHTIPAVEAELSDLDRDYDVVKRKHQELLQRREQATITAKASQASDDIEFKVIDPTRVPFEPSGPPRIIYMSGVLVGGLALGLGFSLLLVILKPTFSSIRMLALSTGLPILGSVSMVQDSLQISRSRRHLFLFFSLSFLLLIAYSALLLYQLLFVFKAAPLF